MTETADWYHRFGGQDARGSSPLYEEWALAAAEDDEVLRLLEQLPLQQRSPVIVFGVARLLGAPESEWHRFRAWLVDSWPVVAHEARSRGVQTNDPRRCAALLPLLATLDGPLALVDIGASAGLCLYPDRYAYRYDDRPVLGNSTVLLECTTSGAVPVPDRLPEVALRVGVDRTPLLLDRPDDMRWLEALLWPEQHERRALQRAAIELARTDPPTMFEADAITGLAVALAGIPRGVRPVVITTGVLVYLPRAERMRFIESVRAAGCDWIALEAPAMLPDAAARLRVPVHPDARFLLALNERPVAFTAPHGTRLHWLGDGDLASG
ncbi:DUF2332 domain-containing protein [Lysobacter korlensis]|uniref:DUF2332 domain-containing protein n=1 Tax=Lysobacter korlensis TaxID=553636 RepID=A0ABV6RV94_9GAMM